MSSSGSSSGASGTGKGRGARGRRGQTVAQAADVAPGGPPSVPESEAPSGVAPSRSPDRMADDMKKLELVANIKRVADRPGIGTLGRPVGLAANFFQIGFAAQKELCVHRYQVEISHPNPKKIKMDREEYRAIFWDCVMKNPQVFDKSKIVFDDSHCCYTLDRLTFPSGQIKHTFQVPLELTMDNRPTDYTMAVQYTGSHVVDLKMSATQIHEERTHTSIQVVDLILSQGLRCPVWPKSAGWHPHGRGIYRLPTPQVRGVDLGGGREMWSGFTAAAKVGGNWKPLLNVDVSNSAFVKATSLMEFCIDVVNAESGGGGGPPGGGRGGRGGRGGGRGGYNGRGGDAPRYSTK